MQLDVALLKFSIIFKLIAKIIIQKCSYIFKRCSHQMNSPNFCVSGIFYKTCIRHHLERLFRFRYTYLIKVTCESQYAIKQFSIFENDIIYNNQCHRNEYSRAVLVINRLEIFSGLSNYCGNLSLPNNGPKIVELKARVHCGYTFYHQRTIYKIKG